MNEIGKWLSAEKLTFSLIEDPNTDFTLGIPKMFNTIFPLTIVKFKETDMLWFQLGIAYDQKTQQAFSELKPRDQFTFKEGLQRELMKMGIEYDFSKFPSLLLIMTQVYIEDMSRTTFMGSIRRVKDGAFFINSTVSQKLGSEGVNISPSFQRPKTSPYG